MAKIASNSRFRFSEQIKHNDHLTIGRWKEPSFLDKQVNEVYVVPPRYEGRVDLIAHDRYGDSKYFWAIIAYNAPRNPLNWPKAGDTIKIPNISNILLEL